MSLTTLCLTLLGFGYDLGYLGAINLRPEQLQRTPVDFLVRSWLPFYDVMLPGGEFRGMGYLLELWRETGWRWWLWLLMIPVLGAFFGYLVSWVLRFRKGRLGKLRDRLLGAKSALRTGVGNWVTSPTRRWVLLGWFVWGAEIALIALALAVAYMALSVTLLGVATLPLAGYASGKNRAKNELVEPLKCLGGTLPTVGTATLKQATCIKVLRDGVDVAQGYLVDYGAGRVFIYDPCTRQPLSISLDRVVIRHVDALDASPTQSNCTRLR
ncbi:MAG: hypothetical protein EOO28_20435 [Comamonadaceae bacterium]|nr:MAG: hypothetical protein EOO28_20435 [Comamonadaceae bacterium]